jgi:hypothetical protein
MSAFFSSRKFSAAALAASVLALAACGGGSSDDGLVGGPQLPGLTDQQALRVTAASLGGGPMALQIPATLLSEQLGGLIKAKLYQTTPAPLDISTLCTAAGGRLLMDVQDADNSRTFSDGDLVSLTFTNCALSGDGASLILNGALDLTVATTAGNEIVTRQRFTSRGLVSTVSGQAGTHGGSITVEDVFGLTDLINPARTAYTSDLVEVSFAGGRVDRLSALRWPLVYTAATTTTAPLHTATLIDTSGAVNIPVSTVRNVIFNAADGAILQADLAINPPRDAIRALTTGTNALEIRIDQGPDGFNDRILRITAPQLLNSWN